MTPAMTGLMAGASAIAIEVIFSTAPYSWGTLFLVTLPLQAVINYGIYTIVRGDSILAVAIWFSGTTSLLRLGAQLAVGSGTIGAATWLAYGLTLLAVAIKLVASLR